MICHEDPLVNALIDAAEAGNLATLCQLAQRGADRAAWCDFALGAAAESGHVEVVEWLLRNEHADPGSRENVAIQLAAANGHAAVVERLLLDARVDPSSGDNFAICNARHGSVDVVHRLLQDPRVNPSANRNYALRRAARKGNVALAERLLQDARVDPSAFNNRALRAATERRQCTIVNLLLQQPRVRGSIDDDVLGRLTHIGMVRSWFALVCIGLQDLDLPALVTLEILDAMLPNNIRMAAKWDLIVAVKHFHASRPPFKTFSCPM